MSSRIAITSFVFVLSLLVVACTVPVPTAAAPETPPPPTLTTTFTPSPAPTDTATDTPTATATDTPTATPTNTPTSTPTNTPATQPFVTLDNWTYFKDYPPGPRVDVTFSAYNMPDTYRPMVVVKDWIGNLFGWTHIEGAGSGTYTLTGITIGTVEADCDKTFTIYMIITPQNRVAGQINQLPAGYMTQRSIVRQC